RRAPARPPAPPPGPGLPPGPGDQTAMPLFPAEPALSPDDLLTAPAPPGAAARWYVLHTRPRAEKALARKARAQGLPYFLPQYKRQWRARGRALCAHVPLFPGYLFLRGDGEARRRALETNLVANCLEGAGQERLAGGPP